MRINNAVAVGLGLLILLTGCRSGETKVPSTQPPPKTRAFHLGYTPLPYDLTVDAVTKTYDYIAQDGDLVAHHFDAGIPWNEALTDTYPYDANIMNDWQTRKTHTPAGHKVYVATTPIAPLRDGMAPYRKNADNLPLVAPFDAYGAGLLFNHADVKTAYLNYCKRLVAFFNPDYLAIGIEVNLLRRAKTSADWARYVELQQYVYAQLKALYPNLPIFASFSASPMLLGWETPPGEFAGNPSGFRDSQIATWAALRSSSDYFGVSFYPYISPYLGTLYPTSFPATMFADIFSIAGAKPIAMAETGYPAADMTVAGNTFVGSQAAQTAYFQALFGEADKRKLKFIVNFVPRDYGALCQSIGCPDWAYLWETTGTYDASGNPRTSQKLFRDYVSRSYKP